MISKTKAKSEMKKEHKLWEKASITDLKKSEKCGEYGEPCLALKNRTCFEGTPCRLCYIGMGYEQGKKEQALYYAKLLKDLEEKLNTCSVCGEKVNHRNHYATYHLGCLNRHDDIVKKRKLEEVLEEYKKLIDEAPTISHKDSIDFGCGLEQKIKEASK